MSLPQPDSPLAPDDFVGRQRIVDDIVQRLRQTELNSTQVAAGPRAGKTSLLRYLASAHVLPQLGPASALLRVYVDAAALGRQGSVAEFWERCLREMQVGLKANTSVPQSLRDTMAREQLRAESGKLSIVRLENLFDDCAAAGCPVVLLLDEFDVLLDNANFVPPVDFFDQMRSLCQRHPRGLALVMGTTRPLSDSAPTVGPSPFYNHFSFVRLGPLDDQDLHALCTARARAMSVVWPEAMTRRIAQASFAHPYLASHLIDRVLRRAGGARLDDDDVIAMMQDPTGPYMRLAAQIDARLKPAERATVQAALAGAALTEAQHALLQRLRDSCLLPPGVE